MSYHLHLSILHIFLLLKAIHQLPEKASPSEESIPGLGAHAAAPRPDVAGAQERPQRVAATLHEGLAGDLREKSAKIWSDPIWSNLIQSDPRAPFWLVYPQKKTVLNQGKIYATVDEDHG